MEQFGPQATVETLGANSDLRSGASFSSEASFRDYAVLLKPRVMSLVVFTALVGLMAAPQAVHPVIAIASLLCVAVGAGASGALNMWWDADIDVKMRRTQARPVPSGRVDAEEALAIGVALSALSIALLSLFANFAAAALLAVTIAFYLFVYTMWLKRRTPQNIVIGGAAGAFPPMIGWAIATGGIGIEALSMFAIIFLWTPPHSWALALFRNEDYAKAGVPMLPVAAGPDEARRQIWIYSLVLAPAALSPLFLGLGGVLYAVVAGGATLRFVRDAWRVSRRTPNEAEDDDFAAEKRFFGFSILYLFIVFLALLAEATLRIAGLTIAV